MRSLVYSLRRAGIVDFAFALVVVLLLGKAGLVLLGHPISGVADNGDGWRVMEPAGIAHTRHIAEFRHRFVRRAYDTEDGELLAHPSSSAALAALAKQLPWGGLSVHDDMDLRQMGLLYFILMCVTVVLARQAGVALGWIATSTWVLVDPIYLLFFNSFYADAATLWATWAAVLWVLAYARMRAHPDRGTAMGKWTIAAAAVLVAAVAGFSSRAHQLFPLLLAGTAFVAPPRRARRGVIVLLVGGLMGCAVLAPALFEQGRGFRFPHINGYHTVFHGVAELSDDPERVLDELDIDRRYVDHVGRRYFGRPVPGRLERRVSNVSRLEVLRSYLQRPRALARLRSRVEGVLDAPGPLEWLGNRTWAPQRQHRVVFPTRGGIRQLRAALTPDARFVWMIPTASLAWLLWGTWRRRPWSGPRLASVFSMMLFGSEIVVATLGDGTFALRRHLLVATMALDLLTVLLGGMIALQAGRAVRAVRRSSLHVDRTTPIRAWAFTVTSGASSG